MMSNTSCLCFVLMLLLVLRRAIQQLTKKVAELEAGLTALLSGQAIPPAAAAALIAAISRIRSPAGGAAAAQSKPGSQGGSGRPARNRSEGAAVEAGGIQVPNTAAPASPAAAQLTEKQVRQPQDLQERADELDSVIKAINEVKLLCPNSVNVSLQSQPCDAFLCKFSGLGLLPIILYLCIMLPPDDSILRSLFILGSCCNAKAGTKTSPSTSPSTQHADSMRHLCMCRRRFQPSGGGLAPSKQELHQRQRGVATSCMQQQPSVVTVSSDVTTWSDDASCGPASTAAAGMNQCSASVCRAVQPGPQQQPELIPEPPVEAAGAVSSFKEAASGSSKQALGTARAEPAGTAAEHWVQDAKQQELLRATGAFDAVRAASHNQKVCLSG